MRNLNHNKKFSALICPRRVSALLLAAVFASACLVGTPALAADEAAVQSTCDEAYYATLDYYGGLQEGSIVKSYLMNGATSIRDYGTYDEVINLTDDTQPALSDGSLTFAFNGKAPDRFYFEGKSAAPYAALPWSIGISYRLNGVPAKAEDLAGKQGLVEINVDALPRETASEYSKNNCVLQAVAVFNADDILSLEAPGAQVQLIGNLKTVLFMAMPGEEQHFSIRVGSDDFSFSGITFLIVPATLSQLDQIADLRDAKEKTQDSYDAINSSLDVILNTLDGMSGSLEETADGLEQLDSARAAVSEGKGTVYEDADSSISALTDLAGALSPVEGHLTTAGQALTDLTDLLTQLTDNTVALKEELQNCRDLISDIQEHTDELRDLLDDLNDYDASVYSLSEKFQADVTALNSDLGDLKNSLAALRATLTSPSLQGLSTLDQIQVDGLSLEQIGDLIDEANSAYEQYVSTGARDSGMSFEEFLASSGAVSSAMAVKLAKLYEEQDELKLITSLVDNVNQNIEEVNALLPALVSPSAGLLANLESLCDSLGESGLGGDLGQISELLTHVLDDLSDHEELPHDMLVDMDELGDLISRVTENADTSLDLLQSLDDTVNSYVPDAQQALADAKTITNSATDTIGKTADFLKALESLLKKSGTDLDEGTKNALNGLSDSLRRSAAGVGQTGTIRSAKDAITKLIDDEWNAHTGEDNRVLLMDASAKPVSLTSGQNQTPSSIQAILRSEEIKVPDEKSTSDASSEDTGESGTFWSRVADMFLDFWHAVTGLFTHGKTSASGT